MRFVRSKLIEDAIRRADHRGASVFDWVMSNAKTASVCSWDGDNPIDIAERAIEFGAAANKGGKTTIHVVDYDEDGNTYFFLEDETAVVAILDTL